MSVKVGVIGVGRVGIHHARNYADIGAADLVGVYDIDPGKAEQIAERYSTRMYQSLDGLLEETDAVSICVPTTKHYDVFEKVAGKKVHALVEKPISSSISEASKIINEAKRNKVTLMVGHVERFNPVVLTLQDIIDEEDIVYIETQRLGPYVDVDTETNVVDDLMIHDIDIVLNLIDSKIEQVNNLSMKVFSKTEDVAHAQLLFASGKAAVLSASRVANRRVRVLNITLKDSYISADYQTQEVFIRSGLKPEYIGAPHVSYKQVGAIEIPYVQRGEPLRLELEHFIDCIACSKAPMVSGEAGKRNLEVAELILSKSIK